MSASTNCRRALFLFAFVCLLAFASASASSPHQRVLRLSLTDNQTLSSPGSPYSSDTIDYEEQQQQQQPVVLQDMSAHLSRLDNAIYSYLQSRTGRTGPRDGAEMVDWINAADLLYKSDSDKSSGQKKKGGRGGGGPSVLLKDAGAGLAEVIYNQTSDKRGIVFESTRRSFFSSKVFKPAPVELPVHYTEGKELVKTRYTIFRASAYTQVEQSREYPVSGGDGSCRVWSKAVRKLVGGLAHVSVVGGNECTGETRRCKAWGRDANDCWAQRAVRA